jgi:hypothetical protein
MINTTRVGVGWLVLAFPFWLAVVFSSSFSPPFASPKNAILIFAPFSLLDLVLHKSCGMGGNTMYCRLGAISKSMWI